MLLKIKNSEQTLRHTKQMLRNKIIGLKKIYKFYFDHFLIKCTVFVLNVQNVIKNQKLNFLDKLLHAKKMSRNKIVRFKKMYKSYFDHFLIGIIVFLINMKNAIE